MCEKDKKDSARKINKMNEQRKSNEQQQQQHDITTGERIMMRVFIYTHNYI